MDHKLTEIGEGKHPFVIRKGVIHDQEERYHDKDGQEQDIRNGPVPSSHKKCRKRIDHFLPFLSMNNSNFIRGDRYADMVSIIPYIVGIDKDVLVPIRKHGQMIMVAFVEDKFHLSGQATVFLVILQDHIFKIDLDFHRRIWLYIGYLLAFERTA